MITRFTTYLKSLLLKSDRLLRIDTGYLIKGGFWLSIGQVFATASGFFVATAFANFVPQEVYGNYKYALGIISILTIFTLPGLNAALATAVAGGKEGDFIPAIKKKISWGRLGGLLCFAIAVYYFYQVNTELALSFLIAGLFMPFMDSVGLYNTYLQSKKLFKVAITYFVSSQLFATASIILAVFLTDRLSIIVLTYFLSWTAARLFFLWYSYKKYPPNAQTDPQTFQYGKHLNFVSVLGNITGYLDSLLLFHFLGPIEVAIYNIAIAPPEQVKALTKNIPSLALPKLTERSFAEIQRVLSKRLWILFFLGLSIATVYYFAAPFVYGLFFEKYTESIIYSQIFAFSLMIRIPQAFFGTVMQSKLTLQPKKWLYHGMIAQIILVICLLVLTGTHGIIGVIISRNIYFIISFVITALQWRYLIKRSV